LPFDEPRVERFWGSAFAQYERSADGAKDENYEIQTENARAKAWRGDRGDGGRVPTGGDGDRAEGI